MKLLTRTTILLGWALIAGCSNTRFLVEDELLYTGRNPLQGTAVEKGVNPSDVKPELRSVTSHKVNNALFDQGRFGARAWSVIDTSSRNPPRQCLPGRGTDSP
jgi:hypothetical protein